MQHSACLTQLQGRGGRGFSSDFLFKTKPAGHEVEWIIKQPNSRLSLWCAVHNQMHTFTRRTVSRSAGSAQTHTREWCILWGWWCSTNGSVRLHPDLTGPLTCTAQHWPKHGLLSAQLHSTVGKPDTRHVGEFKLCNHGPHKFHVGTMTKDAGSDVSLGLNPSFPTY